MDRPGRVEEGSPPVGGSLPAPLRGRGGRPGSRGRRTRGSRARRSPRPRAPSPGRRGPSSLTASNLGCRAGAAGRRSGRASRSTSTTPSGPGGLARRRQRVVRLGDRRASGGPPSCRASDSSVAGGSVRGFAGARDDQLAAQRAELAEHRGGVLVVEDREDRDEPAPVQELAQRRGEVASCRRGCARRRTPSPAPRRRSRSGPGTAVLRRGDGDRVVVERAEERLARPCAASAKLRRWCAPAASTGTLRVGGREHEPRAALGAHALGDRQRVGVQPAADDERAAGPHDVDLLLGDRGDRRAEPARVLERDVRQDLHLGAGSRSSRRSGRRARPRRRRRRRRRAPARRRRSR